MAESSILMNDLIFWCGWQTNSLHTIFNYIFNSLSNYMRCGNTISRQLFKKLNEIYGSVRTTLDNIKTEPGLVNYFVKSLFVHKTKLTDKTKFKRILSATILIFYDIFLGIIGNYQYGNYKDTTHHIFHQKIISVIAETQISMETFRKWQDEVIAGFNENNQLAVDVSKVRHGSIERYVGSLCLIRVIDEEGEAIGRLHQTIQNATKGINIMSTEMVCIGQYLHNMVKNMEYYTAKLHQVYKRVEVRNMFFLWEHKLFTLTQLKFCKRNLYSYCYAAKSFISAREGFYSCVQKHKILRIPYFSSMEV